MSDNSSVPLEPPPNCTEYHECLVAWGYLNYLPNVPANAVFVALFTIGLVAQTVLGLRYRTWLFSVAMTTGTALEVVGYGARIGINHNVFIDTWFIMYLCCLTMAPAFFSAAIYLSLSRILTICGEKLSFLKGRSITIIFMSCDFISLVLQAVGGALASVASTSEARDIGVNVMIAGLSSQVAATTAFCLICLHIMWNIRKHPERVNLETKEFRGGKRFRAFIWALAIAITAILIRCSFRVAELSEGFKGELANDEALFIVFESVMMVICVCALTIAHPGVTLGAHWNKRGFHWGRKRHQDVEKRHPSSSPSDSQEVDLKQSAVSY
ncbi:Envelope glycoprotein gp160 [Cladophialophora chaetospira]|uniref:Envelope glycoprotein gp160 n=1 Tax=Cladophialophora chaetospira TaxID=386627 RepID=A0AA39CEB2_9EURO|nr:Envelope glycoprotein gp160 [Cladophialophora chaetospira]